MQDDFSQEQWLRYMDGDADPAMRKHVDGCADCRALVSSIEDIGAMLSEESAHARDLASPTSAELDQMLVRCLTELRGELNPGPVWTPNEAVLLMRALVEPICGPGTAGASILLAIRRSTSGRLTEGNWNLFVSNLSDVMVSVCGSAAGRLVNRAGVCLALREG
jgi:hypothetical protein